MLTAAAKVQIYYNIKADFLIVNCLNDSKIIRFSKCGQKLHEKANFHVLGRLPTNVCIYAHLTFCSSHLDLDPMILIQEYDLDNLKMYLRAKK